MPTTRRAALLATGASIATLGIAGCTLFRGGQPPVSQITSIENFLNAITNGTQGLLNAVRAIPGIPANVLTNAQTAITTVETNAPAIVQQLVAGIDVHGVTQALQVLATTTQTLATILTPFFPVSPIIAAVVEAMVAAAQGALSTATGAASATPSRMTGASAMRLLNSKPLAD